MCTCWGQREMEPGSAPRNAASVEIPCWSSCVGTVEPSAPLQGGATGDAVLDFMSGVMN